MKIVVLYKPSHFCILLLQAFLLYTSSVFSNMSNYKSFGDTKIVPNISKVLLCVCVE